jgi:hypothetical protein
MTPLWETAYDPEDDHGDPSVGGFHVVTVDDLHRRKHLTCPICGDQRPQSRAEDPYCDDACAWLASQGSEPEAPRCANDDCLRPVIQHDGPGRPKKFCTDSCKSRHHTRIERERHAAR